MSLFLTLIVALSIDHFYGEATRYHPLVFFGTLAQKVEKRLNKGSSTRRFIMGILAWSCLVLPLPLLYSYLIFIFPSELIIALNIYVVYWAVALNSLNEHGMKIYHPLMANNLSKAQHYCSYIVSRDTSALDEQAISRATTESMLENGHDGVTATIIYFVLGGAPLVIMHRLSNTLDAMWGYRNEQFNYFGKFSARMDDLIGFISAKLTTLLFVILGIGKGKAIAALSNAYQQSQSYKSHNGGWVMASGATVINVCLGGRAMYFGQEIDSPTLGQGDTVRRLHIKASLALVKSAVILWLTLVFVWQLFSYITI